MRPFPLMFCGALGALAVALSSGACGGDVTSTSSTGDAGGAGGAGGSGSSSSTGNPTGGASMQACLDFCHKLETLDCGGQLGSCDDYCDPIYEAAGAECADELDALFACVLPEIGDTCPDDPPAACKAQNDAYEACKDTYGCGTGECSATAGPDGMVAGCDCVQTCAMKAYKTVCTTDANGSTCDCTIDGMSVGTCDPGATLECSIKEGCCNQFYKL